MIVFCFDTETTNLVQNSLLPLSRQPSIIEFAGVLASVTDDGSGDTIAEIDFLVEPGFPITAETTRLTGIKQTDLDGKPRWPHYAPQVEAMLAQAEAFVGQNIMFDVQMVTFEMLRANPQWRWPADKPRYCTIENSEHLFGRRVNLSDLHAFFYGAPHASAHRAMADVQATLKVFRKLKATGAV